MKSTETLPFGKLFSSKDVGMCVRAQRKAQGLTQAECAAVCGVGVRFVSDLENGKPTMALEKVLQVLKCLGLELTLQPRTWGRK